MSAPEAALPFSAVVGQDQAKLALLLCAVDHRIGGVLLRGDKGTAKSTLARGLAALLPGQAPFVELPIGATEDRVVGTLDITEALTGGRKLFDPGLLAAADGGVLYVDEINLLPDHLVDVLLDVAASGVNRVEREGISHSHPSRFLLIGSMNPEEGDLRPQLLDRFGLAVDVRTAEDRGERAAAVRQRLAFDAAPEAVSRDFESSEADLARRLAACRPAAVAESLIDSISGLCADAGAEGLRADLAICRGAAALAGWDGRTEATPADVRRVAPLALAHRARRDPFDSGAVADERLEEALDRHVPPDAAPPASGSGDPGDQPEPDPGGDAGEHVDQHIPMAAPPIGGARQLRPFPAATAGRRVTARADRGRVIGDREPTSATGSIAIGATVRQAAGRRAAEGVALRPHLVEPGDIREAVREQKSALLIVVTVDASGSMGAERRMTAAKGIVLALLRQAYQKRDLVSLVSFRGDEAEVVLRPTGSVEVARARLADLPTGGRTPLAAGLDAALGVADGPGRSSAHIPVIVLITDGRATAAKGGADPVAAAGEVARSIRRRGVQSVVLDVEGLDGGPRLGLASDLAELMGASYVPASDLDPAVVDEAIASATGRRR